MHSVTYSMGVSLDGYIAGPDGDITAPPPDEGVWRLVTDEIRDPLQPGYVRASARIGPCAWAPLDGRAVSWR